MRPTDPRPDSRPDHPQRRWRDGVAVLVVVALGWSATALVYRSMREAESQRLQARTEAAAGEVLGRVEQQLHRTVEAARSAALMVEAQPALTRAAFMRYAAQLASALPAVGMLEWQPLVPGAERAAFEQRAREQGLLDFSIKEPSADGLTWEAAPRRERYVPILYGWPEGKSPLGFNLANDPVRMASKDEAARRGRPLASGSFPVLRQDIGGGSVMGFAITAPVMEGEPGPQGQGVPLGFLAAVVELPALFAPVMAQAQRARMDLWLFEGRQPQGRPLISSPGATPLPSTASEAQALQRVSALDVAGRAWTLVQQPQASLLREGTGTLPTVVLGLGAMASLLLGAALHRLLRERALAQAARATLARERQRLSDVLDGTRAAAWEHDFATGETHVNAHWERLAGYAPGEHPIGAGYHWRDDCHPDDAPAVAEALRRHFAGETEAYEMEYRHRHKTQGWVWVLARAKVLTRDAEGRPRMMAGTLVDVQARKEAEARIQALNATLEARVEARTAELTRALASLNDSREALARTEVRATLDTLVANVAQQLHTPLGNSVIAVQNLSDRSRELHERLDGPLRRRELVEFVDQVQANAELAQRNLARATHLLDTFRQVASAPAGEQARTIDLREWLGALSDTLAHSQRLQPHALTLDIPEGLRLLTAPGLLGQVLTQLLQHLATHAFPAGHRGQLLLRAHEADGHLILSLGDDGPGLPPDSENGLFAPLLHRTGADGRTPLGLAIADQLLRQDLGGSLRVVGLPGPGTRFEIRLPLSAPPAR
ncbi:CHASE domain-containing sensor histidine kinase [Inhella crocodyli]|uniref:histidine kinase n=1 Tax=Inhella crocodyli TaxID=2499851 RepID=A0A3S2UBM8_9BURK|nr:CHASE domain-containing protein [Inhella crocodyli]RVT83691.1 PAS domain S-box protein [Inhella crocodyli]